jgi:tRNA modification GTPase
MDTIFALASAVGKAGVAVIRLSGARAHQAVQQLTGHDVGAREMAFRRLCGSDGKRLDEAMVLSFSAPASFTGEDVAELQIHGSAAVINAVLSALAAIPGLRLAEAGEFTRRALENGKLDLAQVEGLADLIDAETEAQRRLAQTVLAGALGDLAEKWRRELIRAAALIEATIDFVDEDVPVDVTPEVNALLTKVAQELRHQVEGVAIAERIRSGFEVAIVGAPNVGKSTLLNALAGRQAAITSEFAGTTRDVIEVRMDLGGLPVTLLDTAGIRETEDTVEGLGITLARDRAAAADVRVFLADEGQIPDLDMKPGDIQVFPKGDLRADGSGAVSGMTGQGVDDLIRRITTELAGRSAKAGIATRLRHAHAMKVAEGALADAQQSLSLGPAQYDIVADEIRVAVRALETLVGRIDVENLLDEIFSSFCVGK